MDGFVPVEGPETMGIQGVKDLKFMGMIDVDEIEIVSIV